MGDKGVFQKKITTGVPRLLCTEARHVGIAAIPHILFHMYRHVRFALGLSYENKSQVGKIALAISAFRSEEPDLCRSPIRSEGR